jgi:hypothetical protein
VDRTFHVAQVIWRGWQIRTHDPLVRSRRQNAATQQQSATQQQQATFAKARGACLEGRGYTVK